MIAKEVMFVGGRIIRKGERIPDNDGPYRSVDPNADAKKIALKNEAEIREAQEASMLSNAQNIVEQAKSKGPGRPKKQEG